MTIIEIRGQLVGKAKTRTGSLCKSSKGIFQMMELFLSGDQRRNMYTPVRPFERTIAKVFLLSEKNS